MQTVSFWTHFGVGMISPNAKSNTKHHFFWILQNLCSSSRFLICFFWKFHDFTIKKSSKTIRGVVKSEGPVRDVAKSCKRTYFQGGGGRRPGYFTEVGAP